MNRNILSLSASFIVALILSTGCRHHRAVVETTVYTNNPNPPVNNTVVYNNTPPPVNNTVVYNQQEPIAPIVNIAYPATNFTSSGNYITVQGNIRHILSAHQVSISQNGYPVRFFTFNPFTGNFHFQTFLQPGANNIIVTANNFYGTGSQGTTVFFNQSYNNGGGYSNGGNYPNNSINVNNGNVNNGNYPNNSITPNNGNVNNGNYPNNSITPNNGNVNNGNYPNNSITPNNGNTNTYPNGGANTITPNIGGSPIGASPEIKYLNPPSTPELATGPTFNVNAMVRNVTNASQITVSVNGSNLPSFNFNPSTHSLTFVANLLTGFNSIHILATNSAGTDSKSTVLDYKPVGKPPRIDVFNPASSPFTSLQQNMIVSGYVYNVTSSSEINVQFDGSPISFNYNQSTQEIDVSVNLSSSSNQLTITANNPSGTDTKSVTLLLVNNNPHTAQINPNIQTNGAIQPNVNNNNTNNTPHTGQTNPNLQTGGVTYIDQTNTNNTPHTGQTNPNLQTGGVTYIDQTNTNNTPHTGQTNPNLQTGGVTYIDQTNTNNTPHTGQTNPNLQTGGATYIDQTNTNNTPHTNHNPSLQTNGVIYVDQPNNANSGGSSANGMAGVHHQPEITRTSPTSSPYTTMSGIISAALNVSYVTSASGVTVTYNGSPVSFSYNPQTSEALNFTSPLSPGMNTFVVRATNSSGTASQNVEVNYVPTNTSGNANGNPSVHFASGTNTATNTPKEFAVNNTQQKKVAAPAKINAPSKPVQKSTVRPR